MLSRTTVLVLLLLIAGTAGALHPLEPPDTSSPRATIRSFLSLVDERTKLLLSYRESPNRATLEAIAAVQSKGYHLFDLSEVPPAARKEVANEVFLLLWDVLARVEWPDLEEIPDASAFGADGEKGEQPARWRIPGTAITIARVEAGADAGEFLFSPDTVMRAPIFYEQARRLPYQRPMPIDNIYAYSQRFTGWMIPPRWVEALPYWATTLILGQMLWKWFALLLLFGLAVGAVVWIARWGQHGPWRGTWSSYLRRAAAPLLILALEPLLRFFVTSQINVTGVAAEVPGYVLAVASGGAVVWLVWTTTSWIAERIIISPKISSESLTAQMIRLIARSIGILAIIALGLRVAHAIGIPVYGLVAGAGVGGIAIALAAKSTLENFIGTLNLYGDRPVKIGDFCRYGEDPPGWQRTGTIEEIGLRSTRIRGLDRTLTTIPNGDFANMHIINLTARERILLSPKIRLRHETTPDQLRVVLADLREMLLAHPRITDDPARARACGFGEYSIDLELFAYVATSDWNEFLAIQEDVVLRIIDIVQAAGTAFAYPSRILYHQRDSGLDPERQEVAGKRVRKWASAHALPFPEFPDDYRKQIIDTLDYPPEGSPHADRG